MLPLVALKEVTPGPAVERPQSGRVGHMTDQLTLAASILPLSTLDSRLSTFCPNSFRLIHFRKNASATPLVSHTFKTKDLKPFRFTHFQKKGGWLGPGHRCPARKRGVLSNLQTYLSNLRSSLTPLDSALTSKRVSKSFTCNTYEKHTQGEGGVFWLRTRLTGHERCLRVPIPSGRVTSHGSHDCLLTIAGG